MNRGRIQAQGGHTEKSSSWATENIVTKTFGIDKVDNLQNQLTRPELRLRTRSLQKVHNIINTAPHYGISAEVKKTYYDDISARDIRVDLEINCGIAFVDNLQENENE